MNIYVQVFYVHFFSISLGYIHRTGTSGSYGNSAGDPGSIPGLERSPGEGNGNLPQYSCLGDLMNKEAW